MPVAATRLRRRIQRLRRDNRGVVAVMTAAMVLPVFMGSAAMGVDISGWYATTANLQKAADFAALGGAAHLPTSPSAAAATATSVAAANGFRVGDGVTTAVNVRLADRPNQLQVEITASVVNSFGGLIGTPRTSLTKRATAEYTEPYTVGSPCNLLGNEPLAGVQGGGPFASGACPGGSNPRVWAEAAGPNTDKKWGNARDTRVCASGGTDRCTGRTNLDYGKKGHFYKIEVRTPGPLRVQLFDPVLVHTGSTCEDIPAAFTGPNRANPWTVDAKNRYAGGRTAQSPNGAPLCTGDHDYGRADAVRTRAATTFALRAPGDSPDPMASPIVCTEQWDGFSGDMTNLAVAGRPGYRPQVGQAWRQWVDLCTVNASVGTYYLQVRTNVGKNSNLAAGMNNTGDPGAQWAGKNGYSVRATVNGNGAGVTIGGDTGLALSLNVAGDARFHMARIGSQMAGRLAVFNMFDLGDADAGRTGTVQLMAPPDSSGFNGTTISSCRGKGVVNRTLANCTLNGVTAGRFDGRWQALHVRFPATYRCNDTDPNGCWFRVGMRFSGDGRLFDATSWNVGSPESAIRLIK